VAMTDDDRAALTKLESQWRKNRRLYNRLDAHYEGVQRLDRIGIAVPEELSMFKAAINVPRVAVDEVVRRQALRGFQRSGKVGIDKGLQEAWDANNLTSQSILCHLDTRLYGRGFIGVSTNPDEPSMPRITVESPEGFAVDVDPLRRTIRAALRRYTDGVTQMATLYLPDMTRWLARDGGRWVDAADPDEHNLGRVPLVMLLNRARTGRFTGVSEMADVIEKTEAIARIISNMQVGAEALAWPKRWAAGVAKGDFVDAKTGEPLATWDAYMTAIFATGNKDAKFGEYAAADLANFHKAVDALLSWCALELGLPLRFLGQESVNPTAEGAIRADEARLNKNVELKNAFDGDSWAWTMGLYERFRLGKFGKSSARIRALWFDPATPTISQRADAMLKLFQAGILSREGTWDEMGWDEARKDRERAYFAAAADDPLLQMARDLAGAGVTAGASSGTAAPGN